jgi:hypothetical protein
MLKELQILKYHSFQDLIKNTSFVERKNLNQIMKIKIAMKQYNLDSYFWIKFCGVLNNNNEVNVHHVVELVLIFWNEKKPHKEVDINAVFLKVDWFIKHAFEKGFTDSFVQSFLKLYSDCLKL